MKKNPRKFGKYNFYHTYLLIAAYEKAEKSLRRFLFFKNYISVLVHKI